MIKARRKSGRAFNGAERDSGTVYHAVRTDEHPSWDIAICGTSPGMKGNGWALSDADSIVTCRACLARLEKLSHAKCEKCSSFNVSTVGNVPVCLDCDNRIGSEECAEDNEA